MKQRPSQIHRRNFRYRRRLEQHQSLKNRFQRYIMKQCPSQIHRRNFRYRHQLEKLAPSLIALLRRQPYRLRFHQYLHLKQIALKTISELHREQSLLRRVNQKL